MVANKNLFHFLKVLSSALHFKHFLIIFFAGQRFSLPTFRTLIVAIVALAVEGQVTCLTTCRLLLLTLEYGKRYTKRDLLAPTLTDILSCMCLIKASPL